MKIRSLLLGVLCMLALSVSFHLAVMMSKVGMIAVRKLNCLMFVLIFE